MKLWNKVPTIKTPLISPPCELSFFSLDISSPQRPLPPLHPVLWELSVCTSEKKWHPLCHPSPGCSRCIKNGQSGICSSVSAWDNKTTGGLPVLSLNFRQMTHCVCLKKTIVSANGDWIQCPCQSLDFWASGSQSVWVWRALTTRWSTHTENATWKTGASLAVSRLSNVAFQCWCRLSLVCEVQLFSLDFLCFTPFLFYYKQIQIKITHNFPVIAFDFFSGPLKIVYF